MYDGCAIVSVIRGDFCPRSGRLKVSRALQRWDQGIPKDQKPALAGDRKSLPAISRPFHGLQIVCDWIPSDESLGYFQSSAARTQSRVQYNAGMTIELKGLSREQINNLLLKD